ncbi:hypothetical protein SAMN05216312_12218 [Cohnella sp. OV330]|uniref:XkdQ/YqbQ family protein n=1 Tax=Cohnella sp. OV330 TaxID=1855288 RepID=UPI0008ED788B|nr:hypothetical protein [Cohnella sp. OV330]SFB62565.1 hypothetical protein SAMN05216312_12218 [Cohnella sp. OV330]
MFKLQLVKNDGKLAYDITPLVGNVTWDSNLSLMTVMEFELVWSDTGLFPKNPCDLGDVVFLIEDGQEIYRGVLVTEGRTDRQAIKYTVYDYAWYLGKSKTVYQFNKVSASKAIERILTDFGMLIGHIPPMNTLIDDIFLEKSPAEIIEDIYKREEVRANKRFNVEMRQGKIYFEEMKNLVITGTFRLADNLPKTDVMANPLGAGRTRSIDALRNRVKILLEREGKDGGQTTYEVAAMAADDKLIAKYGLLEEVYKIDVEDAAKAREVSRILLQRLSRIQETNSMKLMGDSSFKAGRLLDVSEPLTGMKGRFIIQTAKHSLVNNLHTMELELVLPDQVK